MQFKFKFIQFNLEQTSTEISIHGLADYFSGSHAMAIVWIRNTMYNNSMTDSFRPQKII